MRILIGCYDIASILTGLAEGFKELGHDVTTFVLERNKFYTEAHYDIEFKPFIESRYSYSEIRIPRILKSLIGRTDQLISHLRLHSITEQLIEDHDLFVFIWNPWLDREVLYKRIKEKGKKIICLHVGSDVRHIGAYKQEFQEDVSLWEQYFHSEDLNEKITRIRLDELYSDLIYSVPDQASLYIRGFNHLYIPLKGIIKIPFSPAYRDVPIIVHAPSRSGIKGTIHVERAIEQLKAEGFEFEYRKLVDLDNESLLRELAQADILVDELLLHGPGVLSLEAMAAGCFVLTRSLESYKDVFNPPIQSVKPNTIHDVLKETLANRHYLGKAELRRDYVISHNDPKSVASGMIEALNNPTETQYHPEFFLEKFVLPNVSKLSPSVKKLNIEVARKYNSSQELVSHAQKRGLV